MEFCGVKAWDRICLLVPPFATADPTLWNSLPEQLRQPDITFDSSGDRWKRSRLVSWAAAPCVWTLRALTRNLLTYLPTYLVCLFCWWLCVVTVWSDDEPDQVNGSESLERQKDKHRSLSKERDRLLRGRDSEPEKAARNNRSDDASLPRLVARERVRPNDGDVASGDRVWSPQQEEAAHEKVRLREDGTARERRGRHRVDEPVLKVWSSL